MASSNVGRFIWHENLTKDPKAAVAFYTEVVGWKTEPFGDDYTMWVGPRGALGGTMKLPEQAAKMGAPPHWLGSVQVADVDATAAQTKKLGGAVYMEPMDIPNVGRYAVIADPQGAALSIFKPSTEMTAHDDAKPGEFCWNELYSSDQAGGLEFYSKLFGWKTIEEMDMGPMGKYVIFGLGERRLGGMMTKPKEMPVSAWGFYTETDDLDAAVDRAKKLGAKVMNGPMDVPGGRAAQLMDPQGAAFGLHQVAKK